MRNAFRRKSKIQFKNLPFQTPYDIKGANPAAASEKISSEVTKNSLPKLLTAAERHTAAQKNTDKEAKRMQSQPDTRPSRRSMPTDEEISDFLIIISVIAKRLAGLIMKEGERQDEQNE